MDPVTLIVGALAAGASAGVRDAASSAVKDGYHALRQAVSRRIAGNPSAELTLAEYESDPDTWQRPLGKVLASTGAAADPEIVAAAQRLMRLLDTEGASGDTNTVEIRGSKVKAMQIGGSRNIQKLN